MGAGFENQEDDDNLAPLLFAAKKGDVVTLIHLLDDMNWDIETKDAQGRTALYHAVESAGFFKAVNTLLSRGASVNVTATDGRTVLVEACVRGADFAVCALIEHGADSDTPVLGKTPAEWALRHGQDVRASIDKGQARRFKKELARGFGLTGQTESVPRIRVTPGKQREIKP
jgi:ankyrin repeat protein